MRAVTSTDIPAPPKPPKRTVPHIEVPDELPPDAPKQEQVNAAEEERRQKLEAIRRAVKEQRSTRLEAAVQQPEPANDDAEPTRIMRGKAEAEHAVKMQEENPISAEISTETVQPTDEIIAPEEVQEPTEYAEDISAEKPLVQEDPEEKRKQELAEKLRKIKQKIRLAAEEVQAMPQAEETPVQEEIPTVEETPAVEEIPVVVETPSVEETPIIEEITFAEEAPPVQEAPIEEESVEEISVPQQEMVTETTQAP